MMLLTIISILCCVFISYQDFKERLVSWVLFPLLGLCMGLLHYLHAETQVFYLHITMNIILTSSILLVLYAYSKFISKTRFLNTSIGLGDILFFYAFSLGFPSTTFTILFACSVFFSVFLFFTLKHRFELKTVPLAGLMGLFLAFVFGYSFFMEHPQLYTL